jgi:hypothetical protein
MSSRSYRQRCEERFARLRRRAEFLTERIALLVDRENRGDKSERSALLWAIEQLELLDVIADVLNGDQGESEKLAAIASVMRSRTQPTHADRERTKGLQRVYSGQTSSERP